MRGPWARRGWAQAGWVGAAMAVVVWFYFWTVSVNGGFNDQGDLDYYRLLVRGWKKGHLHLDIEPRPELLALADPYDPAQNEPYKMGDVSLYGGKYYLYFGAAPALTVLLPYSLLAGREMTMGAGVFIFASIAFLTSSALWLAIRRRYFHDSAGWTAPVGVFALGFGTHLLALAQRPMIWELPISAGVAFTFLSLAACYRAIHGPRHLGAMMAAGMCLGLAVGSRPTCLFAAPLLLGPVWLAWRRRATTAGTSTWPAWWRVALAAAVPLGACGVALMVHNHVRFGNPLEWGQNYQLSGAYEGKLTHFSLRFFPHNFAVYIFQPLQWASSFPFARSQAIEVHDLPGYFGTEEVSGLAVTFPFFWLALALPLAWQARPPGRPPEFTALMSCLLGYALPVMALVMCYFSTCTRYQADFAVAWGVLALLGMLGFEQWSRRRFATGGGRALGWSGRTVAATLCLLTVVMGALVSFDYHGRSLRVTAPHRWAKIESAGSQALAVVGHRLGQITGPRVIKVRFQPKPAGTIETFWQAVDARAGERIVVEHLDAHLIRFGYGRGDGDMAWGRPLRWETDHTHTVEVQLPSLYPPRGMSWWSTGRGQEEFRERTSMAVRFSGGLALSDVVRPLPPGIQPGGAIGRDFSGEVRKIFTRLYREDEIPTGLADFYAPRGGVLRMRVVFPEPLVEEGEPLFAAGAHYRSSIVFAQPAAGGVKFVFENYTFPRIESPPFQPNPVGHLVELEMASFNPDAYGVEATGDVVIRLDGREMMRTRQVGYPFPWGHECIGWNPFGTTCAPEFRGWILDARWIRAK